MHVPLLIACLSFDIGKRIGINVGGKDRCAAARNLRDDRSADTGTPAGHECNLSSEICDRVTGIFRHGDPSSGTM